MDREGRGGSRAGVAEPGVRGPWRRAASEHAPLLRQAEESERRGGHDGEQGGHERPVAAVVAVDDVDRRERIDLSGDDGCPRNCVDRGPGSMDATDDERRFRRRRDGRSCRRRSLGASGAS